MSKRVFFIIALFLVLLPVGVVVAQDDDTLPVTNETVHGDVTLFNENFHLGADGQVDGSVIIFNGNVTVAGTVNEDLVVFNGNIVLEKTAVIHGDCIALNGSVSGETLACQQIEEFPFSDEFPDGLGDNLAPFLGEEVIGSGGPPNINHSLSRFLGAFSLSIMMAFIGGFLYTFAPTATHRIEQAMRERPFATTAVGFLSFGAVPFVNLILLIISVPLVLVCVGLLGFPLILGITLAFMGAGFWAWVLWGKMFGEWVTERANFTLNKTVVVAVGTAVITFFLSFVAFSGPGWMLLVIVATILPIAWGMGATALTRFGTRPFPVLEAPLPAKDKVSAVLETLPDETDSF